VALSPAGFAFAGGPPSKKVLPNDEYDEARFMGNTFFQGYACKSKLCSPQKKQQQLPSFHALKMRQRLFQLELRAEEALELTLMP
jgi:hypothetical protein